jgi:hypothetical protein
VGEERLTELERELIELCSMAGETTTTLHVEMLQSWHERAVVEAALRGLVRRGLMTTQRGSYAGIQRTRPRRAGGRAAIEQVVYEDDYWDVTPAGRQAAGLAPTRIGPYYWAPTKRYATPEEAALEDLSGRARVLATDRSPDDTRAIVLLALNEAQSLYPCELICWQNRERRWAWTGQSSDVPGWSPIHVGQAVISAWGQAPAGAVTALVDFGGVEREAPVTDGYYLTAIWNVCVEDDWSEPGRGPVVRRFVYRSS